jgi:DUF1009 family protein
MESSPDSLPQALGLIAGEGRFPFLVLGEARRLGIRIVTLAIEGAAEPSLEKCGSDSLHWLRLGDLSKCVRILKEEGIDKAMMAGRVRHVRVFDIVRPDRLMLKVLGRLRSRTTNAMLSTLADVLAEEGVELLESTRLLQTHLATEGVMTRRAPRKGELEDIRFGLSMARGLAELDIGQTVVVKGKAVVAAEAMEGTDRTIRRARDVVEPPFVVVKVARPSQDMRFDVPVVGPTTIESMVASGAEVLGLEAGKVLLLDRDEVVQRAEESGISICGERL